MKETAHFIDNSGELFAIITHGIDLNNDFAVVILNSGQLHNIGPNRLHVTIARYLAKKGITTVRLDQSGKGESRSRVGFSRAESLLKDFDEIEKLLARHGKKKFIILGLCSGADDGLIIAKKRTQVFGLVLLDSYAPHSLINKVMNVVRRNIQIETILNIRRKAIKFWKFRDIDVRDWETNDIMLDYYNDFLDRNGRILAIFSGGLDYYSKRNQLKQQLDNQSNIEEYFLSKASHTYDSSDDRDQLVDKIGSWIAKYFIEYSTTKVH